MMELIGYKLSEVPINQLISMCATMSIMFISILITYLFILSVAKVFEIISQRNETKAMKIELQLKAEELNEVVLRNSEKELEFDESKYRVFQEELNSMIIMWSSHYIYAKFGNIFNQKLRISSQDISKDDITDTVSEIGEAIVKDMSDAMYEYFMKYKGERWLHSYIGLSAHVEVMKVAKDHIAEIQEVMES